MFSFFINSLQYSLKPEISQKSTRFACYLLASLFGAGLVTYFGLHIGKGVSKKAAKAVGNSIISGEGVSILLTVFVLIFLRPLCKIFDATDNTMLGTILMTALFIFVFKMGVCDAAA